LQDEHDIYLLLKANFRDNAEIQFSYSLQDISKVKLINAVNELVKEFDPKLRDAADRLSINPGRISEALDNMDRILKDINKRIIDQSNLSQGDSAKYLRDALLKLCPIFPFC